MCYACTFWVDGCWMGLGLGWLLYNTVAVSLFLSPRLARSLVRSLARSPSPLSIPHFRDAKDAASSTPIIDQESWMRKKKRKRKRNWEGNMNCSANGNGKCSCPYFVDAAADKSGSLCARVVFDVVRWCVGGGAARCRW
jgi:hypothetical protein